MRSDAVPWAALASVIAACGAEAPARCTASADCDAPSVCSPAGHCGPLGRRPFVPRARLDPVAWSVVPPHRPARALRSGDLLPLGGRDRLRALLALPDGRLAATEASLVLHAHPDWIGPPASGAIEVRRARPFHGDEVARGEGVPAPGPTASRDFAAGHRGRFVVSLGALLDGASRASLEVRVHGGGPEAWRFASPDALDASLRPHVAVDGAAVR